MKKLFYLLLFSLIFSCGKESSEESSSVQEISSSGPITVKAEESEPSEVDGNTEMENGELEEELLPKIFFDKMKYSLDTILMDPGNAIVNLQYGLSRVGLSADKRKLYTLHPALGILYIFDLNEKRLIEQIRFDKDGPNSIPPLVWNFQLLEDGKFLMSDYNKIGVYDSKALKLETIPIGSENFEQLSAGEEITLLNDLQANLTHQKIFFLPNDPELEKVSLGIFDKKSGETRLIPLAEFGFLTRLNLLFEEGINSTVSNLGELDLLMEKNSIIVFSQGTSSVYVYDIPSGSLKFISPNHLLVPKQKVPPNSRIFSSRKQFEEAYFTLLPQIVFYKLIYDDKRGIYFRFGSMLESSADLDPSGENKVYLFVYDRDFNLLGESEIKDFSKVPAYPFFKDGKLWSFVNVEDELGFALFTFTF